MMRLNGSRKEMAHSLLLKSMESHRQRMHDLIEQSANKRTEKSKWDLTPPRKPSPESIKAAQRKPEVEVDYSTFDR